MYSKGISWINDCRIPFEEGDKFDIRRYNESQDTFSSYEDKGSVNGEYIVNIPDSRGRFPANILVSDDMMNDGSIGGSSYCPPTKYEYEMSVDKFNSGGRRTKTGFGDKGSNSRYYNVDKWFEKLLDD
jgi:hypothetical protein